MQRRRGRHLPTSAACTPGPPRKFVKLAAGFDADVTVTKRGQTVSGRSILGLMMLAAGPGTEIEIAASGREKQEAIEALSNLIEARFEED